MRRLRAVILFFLIVGAVGLIIWRPQQPRAAVYAFFRAESRVHTLWGLDGYKVLTGDHAEVLYTERDAGTAHLVLDAFESVYKPVTDRLGFTPSGLVPIVVRPDRTSLQRAFGWSNGESALGVYKTGVIQMLSPNAWLQVSGGTARRNAFMRLNPLAHEFTHYVLDFATQGNYPRWFTEGLAQRVEHEITGYLWLDPAGSVNQPLYSLQELTDRFDDLDNQALAYRESYLLVDYVAERWGEDALRQLLAGLMAQHSFDQALRDATGLGTAQYWAAWRQWVSDNAAELDAALDS